jgi:hypothetical protein
MKLIGAGLPRTGTLSQKVALEMLGLGPCYHMVNVLGDLSNVEPWQRVYDGEIRASEVLAGCQSTVDWPGAFFVDSLLEDFPDAKVLLSVRDGESWERSMTETIWDSLYGDSVQGDLARARGRIDPGWRAYTDLMGAMWEQTGLIGGADIEPGTMAAAMERYNERTIATVPSDRLLVWSAADGWEPLCEFLELDVPDAPFPQLNDSEHFAGRIIDAALLTIKQWRELDPAPPARPAAAPA